MRRPAAGGMVADWPNDRMSPLFVAAAEAVEEAVLNSLLRATTVESRDPATGKRRKVEAIDIDALRAVLAGQSDAHAADIACTGPDGTVQYFSLTMVPLHTPEGGAVISYADITERKLLEMAVAYRATHDVLTGLANRTLLLERLEHALTARSTGVALLFLDLDHFKLVNDGYGHEAGDRVLLELASRLREHKEELFNLRFQVATGQLDNNRRLQTVRRDIAGSTRSCASASSASRP